MKKIIMSAFVLAVFAVFTNLSFSQSEDVNNPDATNTEVAPSDEICPVSHETITAGEGVEYSYLGTTYKFCCKNCLKKFKAEPMNYIGELQCPVTGESASKDINTVTGGVKYYFCGTNCKEEFEKNPEKYLNKNNSEDSK